MVQSETVDGYLDARSIQGETDAPYGYILDNKYKLGDIVEVTYSNDDMIKERKITGVELEEIEYNYAGAIDSLMDEGIEISLNNE